MKQIILLCAAAAAPLLLGIGCSRPHHGPDKNLANTHAVTKTMINASTIAGIKMIWSAASSEFITHAPLVAGGIVYYADWGGAVYAVESSSGRLVWKQSVQRTDPKLPWRGFCGTGALDQATLYEASAEGTLYALDRRTGTVRWQVRFGDKPTAGNIGTLLCHGGIVYVPVCSMDEGMDKKPGFITDFQGSVVAFDAATGAKRWEFMTVNGQGNGCGVWSGFALDPGTNTLFFGTGNNYTGTATAMSDAMIALDAANGRLKWAKQFTAGDIWTVAQRTQGPDYDFGAAPQLFRATIAGVPRQLVAAGQKSGMFWVLDQATGEVVWKAMLGSGSAGGGFMAPASIGPDGIYAWANTTPAGAQSQQRMMDVAAYDPATGAVRWLEGKAQPSGLLTAGLLAGDLYLVGSLDGMIRAYDVTDGRLAWTSGPMASISTSLCADASRLYFATGIPKMFGGTGEGGTVYCLGIPR